MLDMGSIRVMSTVYKKGMWESGGKAPRTLRVAVQVNDKHHAPLLYSQRRRPHYPLNRNLGRLPGFVLEFFREEKNPFLSRELKFYLRKERIHFKRNDYVING